MSELLIHDNGFVPRRTLAAVLENHQCSDGSVDIPQCLHPYMEGMKKLVVGKTSGRP